MSRADVRLLRQRGGFVTVTSKGRTKAPISSHPVFPAIVALWFAALLGLGSMVLPVVLLEKAVTATGLAAVLPAAQPPLGVTALILIALAAAAIGAIAGLSIARKVAAAQAAPAPRRRRAGAEEAEAEPAAKRPISARDELGMDGLDAPVEASAPPIAGRRRALSITDESRRSDFLERAPVPGFEATPPPPAPEDEPLDLGSFAEPEEAPAADAPADDGQAAAGQADLEQPGAAAFGSASLSAAPHTPGVLPLALGPFAERGPVPSAPAPAQTPRFAAPAPEDIRMSYSAPAADPFSGPVAERDLPSRQFDCEPPPAPGAEEREQSPPRADLAARPLRELGTIELVERFALALQRRAEAEDCALELPAFKAAAAREPQPFEPAAPLEPAPAAPAEARAATCDAPPAPSFAAPPAPQIPAALRPIAFDEDESEAAPDEPLPALSLSLEPQSRPFARPADPPAAAPAIGEDDAPEAGDEEEERQGYSSLLAMRSPLGANREFVRVEDEDANDGDRDEAIEPVVVFPGQQHPRRAAPASDGPTRDPLTQASPPQPGFRPFDGPGGGASAAAGAFGDPPAPAAPPAKRADSGETERALREALEKLQRMSGAA